MINLAKVHKALMISISMRSSSKLLAIKTWETSLRKRLVKDLGMVEVEVEAALLMQ